MICNGLLTTQLCTAIELDYNFETNISNILKMMEYSKTHSTTYFTHEDSLYYGCINGINFATWLYDYDNVDPYLRDIKKELLIEINKSQTLDENVNLDDFVQQESTFIIGICEDYKIQDLFDYLQFKQNRLKKFSAKSTFGDELQECYYYIFFDTGVSATLSTLNNRFSNMRDDIVNHLHQLDEFCRIHPERVNSGYNNDCFSRDFKAFSGIDCSPQSDRDSTANLKKKYINTVTQVEESLTCELHTKFSKYNRDATKQDRIYFHKGKKDILGGKLIVIHIGTHA